ncbi:MAG: nickel pincer cofactor biosynthesis protein LarC [Desulforhabdus sp.]|nr:nickel pincer cofactor biosynthesis protein LarC [Desulforhabdus sp.]
MRIAYFDCFAGASGDMILGALVDAGWSVEHLKRELSKLKLSHYQIHATKSIKHGLAGTRIEIMVDQSYHKHHSRHLQDIQAIISQSDLQEPVKARSQAIFKRLAQAEAKVHGTDIENIHFHEVGAVDAILDVVGAAAGLAALGVERVLCSPLHVGTGTIQCQHGTLPIPAPATAELIHGKPVYSTGVVGELLTPTGAAILTTLSSDFGAMPAMVVEKSGYGAGKSDFSIPNLLRLFIGESSGADRFETERVAVIETGIDDMNPQIYDHLMTKLLQEGALDVLLKPVQMKKNRPGILMTVICAVEAVDKFADIIMSETTTIGLRWRLENRFKARRRTLEIETSYGTIRCKIATGAGRIINISPEYDDCKKAAAANHVPLKEVMEQARLACLTNRAKLGLDFEAFQNQLERTA